MPDDDIERAILACLLWGPRPVSTAVDTIDVEAFTDPVTRSLVLVALEHPDVDHLWTHARETGISAEDLTARVTHWLPPRQREGLAYYVDRLNEAADRRRVRAELLRLADTLERPGGPDRVRARLVMA
jgi:hypothetical protein